MQVKCNHQKVDWNEYNINNNINQCLYESRIPAGFIIENYWKFKNKLLPSNFSYKKRLARKKN